MTSRQVAKKTTSKGRAQSGRSSESNESKTTNMRQVRTKPEAAKQQPKPPPVKSPTPPSPKLVPVPFPGGFRPQKGPEMNERSAHLEKLKQLFESAPISRHLGMSLGYCENGV